MTVELPDRLRWVDDLYDHPWPTADEDHIFGLASVWRRSAQYIREVDQDADWVARDVIENNDARPIDAFGQAWRQSHFNHFLSAQAHGLIGETVHSGGLAVQSAKIALLGILALTATRLMHAKANAFYVPGSAAEEAFHTLAAGRKAIEATRMHLLRFVEEELGAEAYRRTMEILGEIKPVGPAATPGYEETERPPT